MNADAADSKSTVPVVVVWALETLAVAAVAYALLASGDWLLRPPETWVEPRWPSTKRALRDVMAAAYCLGPPREADLPNFLAETRELCRGSAFWEHFSNEPVMTDVFAGRDEWGTPLFLVPRSDGRLTLASAGPNRLPEGGAGDDVVCPIAIPRPQDCAGR